MLKSIFLKKCEDLIRLHSSSFYHAFRVLPSPKKEAVYVIYAFCRLIDDAVDEPLTSPFTLNELRESFTNLDEASGHFIWPALRWLFETFPLTKTPFYTQMDGQAQDLIHTHYETFEELDQYCYQVAGTVGEMLLPVLQGTADPLVIQAGISLGKAMQVVNIIRDVGEDQGRGRRYLPLDLMKRHGYSEEDFGNGAITGSWIALIDELKQRADQWFKAGLIGLEGLPTMCRLGVELAACYYRTILDVVIYTNQYDVFQKRAFVSDERKHALFEQVIQKRGTEEKGLAFL